MWGSVRYSAPSRKFGEEHDLPQIWSDWGLRDHALLQVGLGSWDQPNQKLAADIIRASEIPFAHHLSGDAMRHLALGIVSQFCYDDLAYFLKNTTVEDRDLRLEIRRSNLNSLTPGGVLGWIPSPATMSLIEQKFGVSV